MRCLLPVGLRCHNGYCSTINYLQGSLTQAILLLECLYRTYEVRTVVLGAPDGTRTRKPVRIADFWFPIRVLPSHKFTGNRKSLLRLPISPPGHKGDFYRCSPQLITECAVSITRIVSGFHNLYYGVGPPSVPFLHFIFFTPFNAWLSVIRLFLFHLRMAVC